VWSEVFLARQWTEPKTILKSNVSSTLVLKTLWYTEELWIFDEKEQEWWRKWQESWGFCCVFEYNCSWSARATVGVAIITSPLSARCFLQKFGVFQWNTPNVMLMFFIYIIRSEIWALWKPTSSHFFQIALETICTDVCLHSVGEYDWSEFDSSYWKVKGAVFKNLGFVSKRFLPSSPPPPNSSFLHSS